MAERSRRRLADSSRTSRESMSHFGPNSLLDGQVVLVTGGTGSFGQHFVARALAETRLAKLIIFSRDELKQHDLRNKYANEPRLRFFLGDVRDRERIYRAFDGVDCVVHAAALKQIPAAEYNPFEFVKTNVFGAQNLIDAAIDCGVRRVVALSTDKASSPVNLYGATKLVSDKLFVAGNVYAGRRPTRFAVVRYGNVIGSRGSVIPVFRERAKTGRLAITDPGMTRFWITLDQGVDLVLHALHDMHGGEIYVPKIPSMRVVDLAKAIAPDAEVDVIGIRPGEKLHEEMISASDARRAFDRGAYYVIVSELTAEVAREDPGMLVPPGFEYSSNTNDDWLDIERLRKLSGD
jgi:UDP-N-acetylglucosamine 4,6-dehydratase/5-epimerase